MRTRFELVLLGAEPSFLAAAGQEALQEIRDAEAQLSIFQKDSWLSRLNADAASGNPIPVPAPLFDLLELCQQVHRASAGAFDPTVGPLLDAHGLRDQAPAWEPSPVGPPDAARPTNAADPSNSSARIGFEQVELLANRRVRFAHPHLRLDLGGIGKGWALDRAAELLLEAGVPAALLHGGTSTILSFGPPPAHDPEGPDRTTFPSSAAGWQIGIEPFCGVQLLDGALSVSASRPQSRKSPGHVIDPSTLQPLRSKQTAAVLAPTATLADAWSTALLVQSHHPFSWKTLS